MTREEKATNYCNEMMCTVCSNIRCGYKGKCAEWETRKSYYLAGAKENEQLKEQMEKLLDFAVERTEECDVCPLPETCVNSEGVCPYRNKRINLKEWILRHIEVSTVQTETKQFLEYDKMPNCLGTQTTSGN